MRQNIAVIGTGCWGSSFVRVVDRLGVLYGVCDTEPGRLDALPLNSAVKCTADLDILLGDPAVDAVVIATPAASHYGIGWDALDAGKDVLVERPLALKVDEAGELVRLAEARDRILMVGHTLRYHPAVLRLQELIAAGDLGRVDYVLSSRLNPSRRHGDETILPSFAPHDISVILALLGGQPLRVAAHGEAFPPHGLSDFTLTSLEFAGNVKAHTLVSWLHPFKEQRLTVVGSEKIAVFEDSRASNKLALYPCRVEHCVGSAPVTVKGEGVAVALTDEEPLENECRHFLECCATRIPPRTDGREGLAVLRVLAAAESSLRGGGKSVVLPPSGNGRRRHALTASTRSALSHPDPDARKSPLCISPFYVHPTAVVEPGATVGAGTRVWHWTRISAGARIGRTCVLGQGVFVDDGVVIGDNCRVQNHVSLYRGVAFEDDVFCGPSSVFSNVPDPRAFGDQQPVRQTLVKQGASIGANATIGCGMVLGRYCLIGSGAVVTRDVPDFALMTGVPARPRGWVCRCGSRLVFQGPRATCDRCGSEFELAGDAVRETRDLRHDDACRPETVPDRILLLDTAPTQRGEQLLPMSSESDPG